MIKISLVQPRHIYAEEKGEGQVYLPGSLLAAAARLMAAGADVDDIQDANLRPWHCRTEVLGVNLLGAPYVPAVREKIAALMDPDSRLAVGGQVINGFVSARTGGQPENRAQLTRLFGPTVINGNNDEELAMSLGLSEKLPPAAHISLIPAYELIDDADMKKYLTREFSLYVSQGCKFSCTFCAAVRTIKDPVTGVVTRVNEEYRQNDILKKDFQYLLERAKTLGVKNLQMYLSNLDVFQTPSKLEEFSEMVISTRREFPECTVGMRGLSTVESFLNVHSQKPALIRRLVQAGFHTVGFGIDGMTPEIWKSFRKGHNSEDKCLEAVRIARQEYGITPETLMVFGGPEETEHSLQLALDFTVDMVQRYGAVPRPHVSKDIVPGNELWRQPANKKRVEFLLAHPEYLQALDFTALPSGISHPNEELRKLVAKYYIELTKISGNATELVYPISPEMSAETQENHRKWNIGKFDR